MPPVNSPFSPAWPESRSGRRCRSITAIVIAIGLVAGAGHAVLLKLVEEAQHQPVQTPQDAPRQTQ